MLRDTFRSVRAGLRKYKLRYNPKRSKLEVDDSTLALLAQLGYVELFRGEYLVTDAGYEMFTQAIDEYEEKYFADVRS